MCKRKYNWNGLPLVCAMVIFFLCQCRKAEFMPPAVGEQIPYTDTVTSSMAEVLASSPYTLFYQVWLNSDIEVILAERRNGTISKFTVLVPENEALEAEGWDAATISIADKESLNTLILSLTYWEGISKEDLQTRDDNYPALNLLEYPDLWIYQNAAYFIYREPGLVSYCFRAYLSFKNEQLLLNGQAIGNHEGMPATDGYLWPIKQFATKPTQTAIEVLEEDGRFSLYLELMRYTDALYWAIYEDANWYEPWEGSGYDRDFVEDYNLGLSRRYENWYGLPAVATQNTLFIPTNEAFEAAGFSTLQDLISFNEERGLPQAVWDPMYWEYGVEGEFATDTLLDLHHNWGRRYAPRYAGNDWMPEETGAQGRSAVTVFYSNDLRDDLLHDFMLNGYYTPYYEDTKTLFYRMPLTFFNTGAGVVQIGVKGSDRPPATVVQKDIPTLNGPIHAVDRLLLPRDFTLD